MGRAMAAPAITVSSDINRMVAVKDRYLITINKRIMSKTVELQIEKGRNLVEGLRKHLSGISGEVTNDEIGQMEQGAVPE